MATPNGVWNFPIQGSNPCPLHWKGRVLNTKGKSYSGFFDSSHSIDVRCKILTMILICVSLRINHVQHLFTCLLAICVIFGEMSIQVLCPFLIGLFVFFCCMSSLYCQTQGHMLSSRGFIIKVCMLMFKSVTHS